MTGWVLALAVLGALTALNVVVLYGITHQHRDRLDRLERSACFAPRLPDA